MIDIKHANKIMLYRYKLILEEQTDGHEKEDNTNPTHPSHLLWMCNQILNNPDNYPDLYKVSRWIGFIQGVLATLEIVNVNQERDISRPLYK